MAFWSSAWTERAVVLTRGKTEIWYCSDGASRVQRRHFTDPQCMFVLEWSIIVSLGTLVVVINMEIRCRQPEGDVWTRVACWFISDENLPLRSFRLEKVLRFNVLTAFMTDLNNKTCILGWVIGIRMSSRLRKRLWLSANTGTLHFSKFIHLHSIMLLLCSC